VALLNRASRRAARLRLTVSPETEAVRKRPRGPRRARTIRCQFEGTDLRRANALFEEVGML